MDHFKKAKHSRYQCRSSNMTVNANLPLPPKKVQFMFSPLSSKSNQAILNRQEPTILTRSQTQSSLDTNYNAIIRSNTSLNTLRNHVNNLKYLKVSKTVQLNERPPNRFSDAAYERKKRRAHTATVFAENEEQQEQFDTKTGLCRYSGLEKRRIYSAGTARYCSAESRNFSRLSRTDELALRPTGKIIIQFLLNFSAIWFFDSEIVRL